MCTHTHTYILTHTYTHTHIAQKHIDIHTYSYTLTYHVSEGLIADAGKVKGTGFILKEDTRNQNNPHNALSLITTETLPATNM